MNPCPCKGGLLWSHTTRKKSKYDIPNGFFRSSPSSCCNVSKVMWMRDIASMASPHLKQRTTFFVRLARRLNSLGSHLGLGDWMKGPKGRVNESLRRRGSLPRNNLTALSSSDIKIAIVVIGRALVISENQSDSEFQVPILKEMYPKSGEL